MLLVRDGQCRRPSRDDEAFDRAFDPVDVLFEDGFADRRGRCRPLERPLDSGRILSDRAGPRRGSIGRRPACKTAAHRCRRPSGRPPRPSGRRGTPVAADLPLPPSGASNPCSSPRRPRRSAILSNPRRPQPRATMGTAKSVCSVITASTRRLLPIATSASMSCNGTWIASSATAKAGAFGVPSAQMTSNPMCCARRITGTCQWPPGRKSIRRPPKRPLQQGSNSVNDASLNIKLILDRVRGSLRSLCSTLSVPQR